ncbi:MAG TPA: hypothetical protein PKC30_12490 [Saprospiraceae bacterium]|nr:hypothetical protein [Saprospiraceae bacterium]
MKSHLVIKIRFIGLATILSILVLHLPLNGQDKLSPLFNSQDPLSMKLGFVIKDFKKETNDSVFLVSDLEYMETDGEWESLSVNLTARGNFRKAQCYLPQIKIKTKKSARKNTLFDEDKTLKLVLPCKTKGNNNDLIVKEYLAYKLFELISPYHFKTRLVNLYFYETDKKDKGYDLIAFLIEDDKKVAERHNAKVIKGRNLHPMRYQDTASVRQDFFQYMIANTDWSVYVQHNIKALQFETGELIPVPYDFDMAGMVNAPYATVNEELSISSVRERLYRGFCRDESLFRHVKDEYLAMESTLSQIAKSQKDRMSPKEFNDLEKFLSQFFDILKNDKHFKDRMLGGCRTN